ncbi:GntR family transcriptional regulator, partial [Enterobacter intestinihominis]
MPDNCERLVGSVMCIRERYGFSRMTINRALRELTDEGLLVRLQG